MTGEEWLRLLEVLRVPRNPCVRRLAALMDKHGAEWCRDNQSALLAAMQRESERKNWPHYDERLATLVLRRAIRRNS